MWPQSRYQECGQDITCCKERVYPDYWKTLFSIQYTLFTSCESNPILLYNDSFCNRRVSNFVLRWFLKIVISNYQVSNLLGKVITKQRNIFIIPWEQARPTNAHLKCVDIKRIRLCETVLGSNKNACYCWYGVDYANTRLGYKIGRIINSFSDRKPPPARST